MDMEGDNVPQSVPQTMDMEGVPQNDLHPSGNLGVSPTLGSTPFSSQEFLGKTSWGDGAEAAPLPPDTEKKSKQTK